MAGCIGQARPGAEPEAEQRQMQRRDIQPRGAGAEFRIGGLEFRVVSWPGGGEIKPKPLFL